MKTSIFDKLNLRPQERRLVVIVGMVLFVLINWWFVWPFFGEWGKVQRDLRKDASTLDRYQNEIARRAQYERKQRDLEQTGSEMLNSETDFQRVVSSQAANAGVYVSDLRTGQGGGFGSRSNQFFQEQVITVTFNSGGKEIVDFLVGIAAQNAMIRVRTMNVRPDSTGTKLQGNIEFVGNYARPLTNAPTARAAARAAVTGAGTRLNAQPATQSAKPPTNQPASKKTDKPATTKPEKKK